MTKSAYNFYRDKAHVSYWKASIWRPFLPPKISMMVWRILIRRLPSERLVTRGIQISSVCLSCIIGVRESEKHIFWGCDHAQNLWQWVSTLISEDITQLTDVTGMIKWATHQRKELRGDIFLLR